MKTTTKILIATCLTCNLQILSHNSNAQTPTWQWAKSAGGSTGDDWGNSVASDDSGNVYVTGIFQSATITFGTTTLTNGGSGGLFLVKYDASGNVLWVRSAAGNFGSAGHSVSTDTFGNVLVTGFFGSDNITFGTTTLTNNSPTGYWDMFIVKYDASGNALWAKNAGGTSDDGGQSVSTDAAGNVFVIGWFNSATISVGTTTLTNVNTNNTRDIFIVKYDASGNQLWAKRAGGTSIDIPFSASSDASGNVLIIGFFYSPTITFETTTLTNGGGSDIFIVKYSASGNVLWARSAVGTSNDEGVSISTDASDNVFVTGLFLSNAITFGTTTLTNAGGGDIFIVKYDSSGDVLWAKSAGGNSADIGFGVSTDTSGNVLVTGLFGGATITFGNTTLTNTSSGFEDIFLVKYDASGNELWAKSAGGASSDAAYGVSTTQDGGSVFITGTFYGPASNFGNTTITTPLCNGTGYCASFFVAKLYDVTTTITASGATTSSINIFPNPSSGKFNLQSSIFNHQSSITIYNLLGECIYKSLILNPKSLIDISLPAGTEQGIYFIKVNSENGSITKKLIIQF